MAFKPQLVHSVLCYWLHWLTATAGYLKVYRTRTLAESEKEERVRSFKKLQTLGLASRVSRSHIVRPGSQIHLIIPLGAVQVDLKRVQQQRRSLTDFWDIPNFFEQIKHGYHEESSFNKPHFFHSLYHPFAVCWDGLVKLYKPKSYSSSFLSITHGQKDPWSSSKSGRFLLSGGSLKLSQVFFCWKNPSSIPRIVLDIHNCAYIPL